jgi:hypothetical protein
MHVKLKIMRYLKARIHAKRPQNWQHYTLPLNIGNKLASHFEY